MKFPPRHPFLPRDPFPQRMRYFMLSTFAPRFSLGILLAALFYCQNIVNAQDRAKPPGESFRPVTDLAVREAQLEVIRAAEDFRRAVSDQRIKTSWEKFLNLDAWCAADATTQPYPEALDDLTVELGKALPGMEFPALQALRQSLITLADRWRDRDDPDFESHVEARLAQMELLVKSTAPSSREQAELAALQDWLRRHAQAPQRVAQLSANHQAPNFQLLLHKRFLSAYMGEPIDRPEEVADEILGTTITGTGQAVGFADIELIPDPHRVAFDIVASVCVRTLTTGVNGPVCILSRGQTGITTRKPIYFDGRELTSLPACSTASTQSETLGINTKFKRLANRLVTRIAEKEIEKKKEEGNAIAASHAERDANIATDEDVGKIILETNAELANALTLPFARRGFDLRQFLCSTDISNVQIKLGIGQPQQLLAPQALPLSETASDITFQIHPTAIGNATSTYIGGDWFWLSDLTDPALLQTGKPAPAVESKDRKNDVGVMLDRFAPVSASFDDGEIRVVIRGEQFVAQEQTWPAMEIALQFRLSISQGAAQLVSLKEPEVFPPDKSKRLSGREVALRRILIARLKKELSQPIALKPLPVKRDERLIGHLVLENASTVEGWFQGGLKLIPADTVKRK
jgi:hypothetical protein